MTKLKKVVQLSKTINPRKPNTIPTLEEIFERCELMPNGCIEWRKSIKPQGYGEIRVNRKLYYVHRFVLTLVAGEPAPGMDALHSCDNRACCNPNHLSWGTRKQNMQDAATKNRTAHGSRQATAKLTEADIPKIFEWIKQGESLNVIGKRLGVYGQTIGKIVNGQHWVRAVASYKATEGN